MKRWRKERKKLEHAAKKNAMSVKFVRENCKTMNDQTNNRLKWKNWTILKKDSKNRLSLKINEE